MSERPDDGLYQSDDGEVIVIDGIRYARSLFRHLANDPLGSKFEIVARDDGTVMLRRLETQ